MERIWQCNRNILVPIFCLWHCKQLKIFLPHGYHRKSSENKNPVFIILFSPRCSRLVSRAKNMPERDTASVLQGVLHPRQQAKADLWGCQTGLQVGRRRAAKHRDGKWAATDREVHTKAGAWRWRLLDRAPSQPATLQRRDVKPRLPLAVLLAGWKQG